MAFFRRTRSKLYPLVEEEMDFEAAVMTESHGVHEKCQVEKKFTWIEQAEEVSFEKIGDLVCKAARDVFDSRQGYHSTNYPTRNLTKWAFDAVNDAVQHGVSKCRVITFCCSKTTCPQHVFIGVVLDLLVGPINIQEK